MILDNNTLFNEEDGEKNKKEDEMDELDLEDDDEDIIPIEETGGGGRKILWTIVVLIIIGLGIYSFAKREQIREGLQTPEEETGEIGEAASDTLEEFTWEGEEGEEGETTVEKEGEQIVIKESEMPELEEFTITDEGEAIPGQEEATIPEIEKPEEIILEPKVVSDDEKITATAQPGEGITHLARRALAEYLEKNNLTGELSAEQKIYIEDYLQNRTGTEMLNLGEARTFSNALIAEAIDAAKQLDEKQLKNLEKYVVVVFGSAGS